MAEQRREEERLLQEERQREKLEKIKAVEGKTIWKKMENKYQTTLSLFVLRKCFFFLFLNNIKAGSATGSRHSKRSVLRKLITI